MSRRRFLRLAPIAVLIAACTTPPQTIDTARGEGRSGDSLLVAGDYDGAARAFEQDAASGRDSPVLREKLANAKLRAAAAHASAALRAADAGDGDRARAELARADALAGGSPVVRDAHASIDGRLATAVKSADSLRLARAVMASDPEQAERLLADAAPDDQGDAAVEYANLRREATLRAEANRSADRAARSWAAGDRDRAVRELVSAQFDGRPVAKADGVRRVIEEDLVARTAGADEASLRSAVDVAAAASLQPAVVRVLRDRLIEKLLASAQDLRDTRRPATGALLELEAKRLRADVKTPAFDQVREAATQTILVAPFDDATGGKVDGARLARALRERLALDAAGGGAPTRVLDESDAARAAHPDALRLTGRVVSSRETGGRVGRENKKLTYQSGTTRVENPDYQALTADLAAATTTLRIAQDEQTNAAAWLATLQGLGFVKGDGTPRRSDAELQTKIAVAQARVDRANDALKRARDDEFDLRQKTQSVPREIDQPVFAEHVLVVTTKIKTAQLTALLDLSQGGESLLSQEVSASSEHKETISDGFAPAGVAPDPDDTPDDAAMAAKAADRFAAVAAGRVRAAAEGGARRRLVDARAAERAGKRDEAAESYSMYLLSTPDVASPERADAARALAELLGVHVALRTGPKKEDAP